jgi:hypothetical protein
MRIAAALLVFLLCVDAVAWLLVVHSLAAALGWSFAAFIVARYWQTIDIYTTI